MLNELYKLRNSLENCGIKVKQMHDWIKSAAKIEGLQVFVGKNGIRSIEYIDKKEMSDFWKISPNNQNNFPIFKFDTPIYKAKEKDVEIRKLIEENIKDKKKQDIKQLKNLVFEEKNDYEKKIKTINKIKNEKERKELIKIQKNIAGLAGRIYRYPKELIDDKILPEGNVLTVLAKRLIFLYKENTDLFLEQLINATFEAFEKGIIKKKNIESIFFGSWNKEKEKYEESSILLAMENSDYIKIGIKVNDTETKNAINDVLLEKSINMNKTGGVKCSLSGNMVDIENDKFPNPNLPIIGPTYLFSMNKDAECHLRYKRISSTIYPVGKELLVEVNSAILHLVDSKKKGKTWQAVPSIKGEKSDLLLVYLESKPDFDVFLASLFSEATQDEQTENTFEMLSENVCKALKGINTGISGNMCVIIISKLDKGRNQVVLNVRYDVSSVEKSVKEWSEANLNYPDIYLNYKKEKLNPKILFLAQFSRLFHNQWIRGGTERCNVIGMPLNNIYDLFIGEKGVAEDTAKNMLEKLLAKNVTLLIGVGGAMWAGNAEKFKDETISSFLNGISAIALLLYKLQIRKEEYMKQAPFYVGRMLALADTLHKEYCGHVRNGEIPPQLIGNALMSVALDNPTDGLSRLSERLPIYQAWAQKVQGDDVGLAKWVLSEMGTTANELSELQMPTKTGNVEKAQILLGYLARAKKTE
jgi:hypothetical protein